MYQLVVAFGTENSYFSSHRSFDLPHKCQGTIFVQITKLCKHNKMIEANPFLVTKLNLCGTHNKAG